MDRVLFFQRLDFALFRKGMVVGFLLVVANSFAISIAIGAEFFVTETGTPQGDGTMDQPWDLQTALDHPSSVQPGDIIWLRGGIHRRNNEVTKFTSALAGAPGQPITVRQFPGERAIIDGSILQIDGGWVNYWGFELMKSYPNRVTSQSGSFPTAFKVVSSTGETNDLAVSGFDLRAPHCKLINLVIHDSIGGGIFVSSSAIDSEIYGTIVFYNGWQGCDRSHGHGLYIQSVNPNSAYVFDNLFLENYAFGIHATAEGELVDNLFFQGNIAFFNGILARRHQGNFLIGPLVGKAKNPVLVHNFIYDRFGTSADANIGYSGGSSNAVLRENYFQTSVRFSEQNQGLVLENNTFLGGTVSLQRTNYPDNVFLDAAPQTNLIEVLTNKYEADRAHIVVYNWEALPNVSVDVSGFLSFGTSFEVRNAQNYLGAPVLTGIYEGQSLDLPLLNLPIAKPVGMNPPVSTAPAFNAFILKRHEESENFNNPPFISSIPGQFTDENRASSSISFTTEDAETPSEYLNLSVLSSDPQLVPNKNIHVSGEGSNREVKLIPAPDQIGSTIITLQLSDGFSSSETSFEFDVLPAAPLPLTTEIGPRLSVVPSGNNITLQVNGVPNADYELRTSGNLLNWRFIETVKTDCEGIGYFTENDFLNRRQRYFQAVRQPGG